jgi:hypothetical protein
MQEKLHFRGVWFLPEEKEIQVTGILDYSPSSGIDLQLFGILNESESVVDGDIAIICGITSDGKKITLYKCHPYQRGFNSNGLEDSSYEALYMFIGLLMPKEELKFKSINIEFQDFDHWLDIYGFSRNEFVRQEKRTFVEYQQPKDLSFSISDKTQCDFKFSTYAPSRNKLSSLTIRQVCEVSLFGKGAESDFEYLFGLFQTFQIFLTLSYFEKPLIKKLTLTKDITSSKLETHETNIESYFSSDVTSEAYKEKNHDKRFLFTYKDVKENLQSILSKWYEAEDSLSPTIYGLSEAFSKNTTAIEFSFLNIAHAIETLHRRRRSNAVLPAEKYKERVKEIINSVDPEYKEWVESKLEFGNEPSLHERIEELISELPDNIKKALLKPNQDQFIKDFKRSRNYYTHYSSTLEKKALKGSDLFYLKERCKILLVCFVLKEIGFSDKELEKIIFNKGAFLFNHIIKYDEVKDFFKSWQ